LATLRTALIGSGVLAILLGGLFGWWVSRRVLRPVADVAAAAERVAGGDLATRIETIDDPDLDSLATSFNHMVDAVERRIERETRFVADVSHELRSPLTTLSTATELMSARRDELSPRAAQALDLLEGEVGRLCRLVDDLLELSRSDAGVADFRPQPVDVAELVRHSVPTSRAGRPGPDPEIVVPEGPALATLDKRRLERVLANLVANAESHGGGLRGVTVEQADGEVRIAVDDAGPGVAPTDRDAVFRRLYRGAASGRRASEGGSGLGLALVAEHVRLHGGRVWIEDAPGGGARFVVVVPGVAR
jgi:signal transduction histidine kinase